MYEMMLWEYFSEIKPLASVFFILDLHHTPAVILKLISITQSRSPAPISWLLFIQATFNANSLLENKLK